jgi:hypothetical protein
MPSPKPTKLSVKVCSLFEALQQFCLREKRLPEFEEAEMALAIGRWRRRLTTLFTKGEVNTALRSRLEALPQWNWEHDDWYEIFEDVENTFGLESQEKNNQHWIDIQHERFADYSLPQEKAHLLAGLPNWKWLGVPSRKTSVIIRWNMHATMLKSFMKQKCCLPFGNNTGVVGFGYNLYLWAQKQISQKRKKNDCHRN